MHQTRRVRDLEISHPKRLLCETCLRPARACICHCVEVLECATEVLILQHPAELKHIKGSARLLHLCLPHSTMLIGEQFEQDELQALLSKNNKANVLLYPDSSISNSATNSALNSGLNLSSNTLTVLPVVQPIRLIVIDASWRQSRQMLMQNPVLQSLPRYALRDVPASRYQIRRAHAPDQLSTLEACTYALMQLESASVQCGRLLDAFDQLNQLQIQFGVHNLLRTKK
nr:tRNA-uridine aminocarboxypropyltransferase [uncultured Undibacterium sp.]